MKDPHLWRLSDDIVPMHMHDSEEEVLVHAAPDGSCEVLSSAREASEIAAAGALADADCPSGVTRRTVLASMAALGALGVVSGTPRYAFAATPTARDTLVVIFLRGAIDGLQVVVPVDDPDYRRARPGLAIRPEDALPVADGFGLHPATRPLLPMWQAGQLAVVNAVGNPKATRSHFDSQLDMERAAPAAVRSGWLGRHLAATSRSTELVRAVTVGSRAAVSAAGFPTASFSGDLENFDVWSWEGYRGGVHKTLDRLHRSAGGALAADASKAVAGVATLARARATKAGTAPYPDDDFGRGLREVARVIKAGAPVEAACLDLDGWDLHRNHGGPFEEWGPMRRLVDSFARGLAAFRTDLGSRWGRTTVVTLSEFGRRVEQNSIGGTDHGHGNIMFVAGGNVVGGRIHGRWPGLASSALLDGDLAITTDYRDVVAEIVTRRLRTPNISAVFPGHTPKPVGVIR
ncbi:uncharacterized protein (DUF1501 family) [Kineosphaera limosa]|uniref:DUF1501 domain-containing protein n=1 Tax=Kineosphaera limosa NBRC 100340 TaxID=1184609 RepID=K6WSR7_9MICO|nr:DUF1501 domain-containing protein [Kineosphaera limosa]NYE02777.1 uncharacterized protein (DUF1501 family) [Kineosphaera limosa]GAB96856.1 hypothetical protein KILIM_050_00380 [Kineosphaera limosa NBRC 100340]